ncbi:kinase-like domain-containing protein [Gigaspora rosea]|uniref:Kinase-like domain-containing protein n=1 Tax=Gigaspora rosea TaxID=44941 RepID=A0A397UGH0_9GLOM|nr:kinase-like domain-containing protein [Gigaspora rosea]
MGQSSSLESSKNWTSGNSEIDKFIQYSQGTSTYPLEWISYQEFSNIKKIGSGGFASVYSAYWEEIYGVVALKVLKGSQNISDEFMNELKAYYKCFENRKFGFLRCYGISRDPKTGFYILVLDYMPKHDLRHNLHSLAQEIWEEKLIVLIDIVKDLYNIHENGFIHRDLHSGNVLIDEMNIPYIADMGLSCPTNPEAGMELSLYTGSETSSENSSGISSSSTSGGVYGILPYIAPELLLGEQFMKATDIYSFGIIMWEISSGRPIYSDREHDVRLKLEIIDGLRPKIAENTPKCYEELMKKCWDKDPNKRPTVEELHDIFTHWRNECKKDISTNEPSEIRKQFDESDRNMKRIEQSPIHPGAIYSSRYIATQKNTINKIIKITNKIKKNEIEVHNTRNMRMIIDLPS